MPLPFAEHFWGSGDKGFQVLVGKLDQGNASLGELLAYWTQKMETEASFTASMTRLMSNNKMQSETSTSLRSALDKLNAFFEQMARSHSLVVNRIKDDLVSPLTHCRDSLVKLRKSLPKEFDKTYKPLEKEKEGVVKIHTRYEAKAAEFVAANEMFTKMPNDRKLQEKVAMLRIELDRLKEDYSESVSRCHTAYNTWETAYGDICQKVEDMERHRITLIRKSLERVIEVEVQINHDFIPTIIEKMRLALGKIDVQSDLDAFVKAARTGRRRSELPTFRDYFDPSPVSQTDEGDRTVSLPRSLDLPSSEGPLPPLPFGTLRTAHTQSTGLGPPPIESPLNSSDMLSPLDLTLALTIGRTTDRNSGTERPSSLASEVFEALKRTDIHLAMDILQPSDVLTTRSDARSGSAVTLASAPSVNPRNGGKVGGSWVVPQGRSNSESAVDSMMGVPPLFQTQGSNTRMLETLTENEERPSKLLESPTKRKSAASESEATGPRASQSRSSTLTSANGPPPSFPPPSPTVSFVTAPSPSNETPGYSNPMPPASPTPLASVSVHTSMNQSERASGINGWTPRSSSPAHSLARTPIGLSPGNESINEELLSVLQKKAARTGSAIERLEAERKIKTANTRDSAGGDENGGSSPHTFVQLRKTRPATQEGASSVDQTQRPIISATGPGVVQQPGGRLSTTKPLTEPPSDLPPQLRRVAYPASAQAAQASQDMGSAGNILTLLMSSDPGGSSSGRARQMSLASLSVPAVDDADFVSPARTSAALRTLTWIEVDGGVPMPETVQVESEEPELDTKTLRDDRRVPPSPDLVLPVFASLSNQFAHHTLGQDMASISYSNSFASSVSLTVGIPTKAQSGGLAYGDGNRGLPFLKENGALIDSKTESPAISSRYIKREPYIAAAPGGQDNDYYHETSFDLFESQGSAEASEGELIVGLRPKENSKSGMRLPSENGMVRKNHSGSSMNTSELAPSIEDFSNSLAESKPAQLGSVVENLASEVDPLSEEPNGFDNTESAPMELNPVVDAVKSPLPPLPTHLSSLRSAVQLKSIDPNDESAPSAVTSKSETHSNTDVLPEPRLLDLLTTQPSVDPASFPATLARSLLRTPLATHLRARLRGHLYHLMRAHFATIQRDGLSTEDGVDPEALRAALTSPVVVSGGGLLEERSVDVPVEEWLRWRGYEVAAGVMVGEAGWPDDQDDVTVGDDNQGVEEQSSFQGRQYARASCSFAALGTTVPLLLVAVRKLRELGGIEMTDSGNQTEPGTTWAFESDLEAVSWSKLADQSFAENYDHSQYANSETLGAKSFPQLEGSISPEALRYISSIRNLYTRHFQHAVTLFRKQETRKILSQARADVAEDLARAESRADEAAALYESSLREARDAM
ncbi:hypothetical protein M427DRAFT_70662 [Gonapodya prolifera JEL478]|uniref:F-BAR domain-containing protein n=1 Tax=Gonapodya prolifera (strain JEL478) TaxID=1344416 RepID=A0A139ACX7_GONPJ|nr:hypothetical protein M427DRAFT_70662 [Gonapodya prolifera JEL478]|eukprot:KXS14434.1 hypothetical protein M427DRAFT_70662 [Gonapodya prolifera JEL478]